MEVLEVKWDMLGKIYKNIQCYLIFFILTYHPVLASQCESRNTSTSPVATLAPSIRARISPLRCLLLTTCTIPSGHVECT